MPTYGKRRALGQHFLRDETIARTIADTALEEARRSGCQTLVEVGPGKGAITYPLLAGAAQFERIILCERDRALAQKWRLHPPHPPSTIEVIEGDFLDAPEAAWLTSERVAVASNLPYSAGTAILTRLARHPERIRVMVLMFQAEVAHRLRAEPGTKSWGSLSVWVQNHWEVKKLLAVRPGAFSPPPDVESEVVVLTPRPAPLIANVSTGRNAELWEELLKCCFAHRRKMLRSGLPFTGRVREALERSGVDGTRRAEALSWNDWDRLAQAILQTSNARAQEEK